VAAAQIDIWFTMGSTYSFLKRDAACRTGTVLRDYISLATISPARHSTRDEARPVRRQTNQTCLYVARRRAPAAMYGIPAHLPAP